MEVYNSVQRLSLVFNICILLHACSATVRLLHSWAVRFMVQEIEKKARKCPGPFFFLVLVFVLFGSLSLVLVGK